ncbi:Glycosyl transferase, family 2 [Minicystis rosea]|nr:Glycosyl transferase, family 2 [Minicystis rosea]
MLPVFNEEEGIADAVAHVIGALERHTDAFEVIAIDDGSTDRTGAILDAMAAELPALRVVHFERNRGYGAALRAGFAASTLPLVFFTDSDDQFDPMDIGALLPLCDEADIVVGYRVGRNDGASRAVLSWGYNQLARRLLGVAVRDLNCAFKVIRRGALDGLALESEGYCINAELIAKAHVRGSAVREIAVRHRARQTGSSKVRMGDVPRTVRDLLAIRRAITRSTP